MTITKEEARQFAAAVQLIFNQRLALTGPEYNTVLMLLRAVEAAVAEANKPEEEKG